MAWQNPRSAALILGLAGGLLPAGCGPVSENVDPGQDTGWTPQDATTGRPDASQTGGDSGVCEDVVDLVFVLDVSSSMGFVLDNLENRISR